jgi:hypothetical protein
LEVALIQASNSWTRCNWTGMALFLLRDLDLECSLESHRLASCGLLQNVVMCCS